MEEKITLTLLSDETQINGDYDERIRKYSCPCGEGEVIWCKERPNGRGYGYQATFSNIFCYCDNCKENYDFSDKGYAKKRNPGYD